MIESVRGRYGRLDVLVNNAGIGIASSIVELSLGDWQRQHAINLDGVFLGFKHAIPLMRDGGGGSILNMSSVAGLKGSARLSAYNATKGGVRLFTKGVALECAQERWNIRVNSVHPGIIDTSIWTKVGGEALQPRSNTPVVDVDEMAETAVPTGVLSKPSDIANGVLFLASDESAYITGAELVIDAGLLVERDGRQWFDLTAFADLLEQPYIADEEARVWSFAEIPARRESMMVDAMAPDFEVPDRQGNVIRMADFAGKRALIVTWSSW